MKHGTVTGPAAAEMMPLDQAGKTTSLAGSNDVNALLRSENIAQDLVAGLGAIFAFNTHFAQDAHY